MNAAEFAMTGVTALAGGGFVAGAIILRPAVSDLAWAIRDGISKGYAVERRVSVKPPATPTTAPGVVIAPPRAPERPAERPAIAPVPEGGDMTGRQAAAVLGVGHSTLRRHEKKWGLVRSGRTGPRGEIWYEAGSVNRYLAARERSAGVEIQRPPAARARLREGPQQGRAGAGEGPAAHPRGTAGRAGRPEEAQHQEAG